MTAVLLFDFDGTIADTYDLALSIGKKIAEALHLKEMSEEEVVDFRSRSLREAVRALKIPLYRVPSLVLRIRQEIHDHIEDVKPFPGLPEALSEVRARCDLMGMVTSNSGENVARFVKKFNLDFFDFSACSTSIFGKASKLRNLIHKHHLQKERVLYIGDTVGDIEACRKVGIKIAAVAWGYNTREVLARKNPDFLLSRPEELIRIAG